MSDQEFHEQIGCYCEPVPVEQAALAAANRIIHGDGSEDDAQLVAGYLIEILGRERWKSEFRTGQEWVPVGSDPE